MTRGHNTEAVNTYLPSWANSRESIGTSTTTYHQEQQQQSALHHYDIGLLGVLFFGNLAGNFVVVPPVKSYHAVVYLT